MLIRIIVNQRPNARTKPIWPLCRGSGRSACRSFGLGRCVAGCEVAGHSHEGGEQRDPVGAVAGADRESECDHEQKQDDADADVDDVRDAAPRPARGFVVFAASRTPTPRNDNAAQ